MSAIQDLKGTLEPKLNTVTIDVGLLCADMDKISEKVTKAEGTIDDLQVTTKWLEEQVVAWKQNVVINTRLEDQKETARCNNILGTVDSPYVLCEAFKAVLRGKAQALIGGMKKERNLECDRLEAEIRDLEARIQTEAMVTLGHRLQLRQQDFRILAEEKARCHALAG
ncbi:hypothetical protein NDU88_006563 [Pleurodeles waltl]|uniref:Tektin n=1 Tax=Pleurodeles waltl TaxID=8319 RepID=A0AAV7SPZ9_PLEWA|nr:hypothetical protein NDU88_006563 [Pleurodeles waltl]